jgi:hypothetical protein
LICDDTCQICSCPGNHNQGCVDDISLYQQSWIVIDDILTTSIDVDITEKTGVNCLRQYLTVNIHFH